MAITVTNHDYDLTNTVINGAKLDTSVPADATLKARQVVFYADGDYVKAKWATNAIGTADFSGAGTDDLTFSGTYTGTEAENVYYVEVTAAGTPDTVKFCDSDGNAIRTGISCSTTFTSLADGITFLTTSASGHTSGDKWYTTCAAIKSGNVSSGA